MIFLKKENHLISRQHLPQKIITSHKVHLQSKNKNINLKKKV
jgi:hypothetical protein